MKIIDFVEKMESLLPAWQQEDFDNTGLLCGDPNSEISSVLLAHDAIENVVDEAIQKGANLIVCFHPIVFSPFKKLIPKDYVQKAFYKAIQKGVALYAVHTRLDNDSLGVNYRICKELGLKNHQVLIPKKNSLMQISWYVPESHLEVTQKAVFAAGAGSLPPYDQCSFYHSGTGSFRPLEGASPFIGKIGEKSEEKEIKVSAVLNKGEEIKILKALFNSHPYESVAYELISLQNSNQSIGLGRYGDLKKSMEIQDFLTFVKEKFHVPFLKHSPFINKKIQRVGVLGGSGASGIIAAREKDCDAYITSDLKYHDFFQAEGKILLIDTGHQESERWVVDQLVELIRRNFPNFASLKSGLSTNPVNYF